jgi:phosphoglycerate dehydrogenase-like enzyme
MRVIATRRTDTPAPAFVERTGKPGDLLTMLPEADVVAVCVPLTPETKGLFNAAAFEAMKRGSYLVNIARGPIVDTAALTEALRSGRLAGACLDVTDPEPLPEGHPLWSMKNVIITPHSASDAELTEQRRSALLIENLRRFGAGEPLLNVVDKKAGY